MTVDWRALLHWDEGQIKDVRALGYDYLRQGQYERAVTFFEGLIVLESRLPYDHQTIGALYLQLGRYEEALAAFDRALELQPVHLPTSLNRAKALLLCGELKEGLRVAKELSRVSDATIADPAQALVMAYESCLM